MPSLHLPGSLVSVDWLNENKDHCDLLILDASWFMPAAGRDGKIEWEQAHIPGSLFFDFDRKICDLNSHLPHMMPDEEIFQNSAQKLGINQSSMIVVYDSLGIFTSPRVWWMLKAMGAKNVAVLDGGLPAWEAHGLAIQSGKHTHPVEPGDFVACYQHKLICDADDVLKATEDTEQIIIDARSPARFLGQEAEARPGLRSGHMPNAKNLPFSEILVDTKIKDAYQLAMIFEAIAPKNNGLIFSCGSGVTACILALGATLAGYDNIAVYDGSWTEWGGDDSFPVVTK